MIKTTQCRKVDVLFDAPLLRLVREKVLESGGTRYTVLPTLGGENADQRWTDDQVTGGAGSKLIMSIIVPEQDADRLLDGISSLIDSYGLFVTSWTVSVIAGEEE